MRYKYHRIIVSEDSWGHERIFIQGKRATHQEMYKLVNEFDIPYEDIIFRNGAHWTQDQYNAWKLSH